MKKRNMLDERQEQALLRIEHNGFWLLWGGLLVAMMAQQLLWPGEPRVMMGEWGVFMAASLYMVGACMKNGIWDRRLKADGKTNLLLSLAAGVICAAFVFFYVRRQSPDFGTAAVVSGAICGVSVFLLCFAALSLMAKIYKKRTAALESEPDEE